jgi:hypothetical protein
MTFRTCPEESTLLAAARAGALAASEGAHLATCGACADAVESERALAALSAALAAEAGARLAAPEVVLLRARLRARRAAEERSLGPLAAWQRLAAAVAAAVVAGGLLLSAGLFRGFAAAPAAAPSPSQLVGALAVVVLAAAPLLGRGARGLRSS